MASKNSGGGTSGNLAMPDGSFCFSAGVDSSKVTTLQSPLNPNGLARNQLGWLNNATVRGGAIAQRFGMQPLLRLIEAGRWQGGFMYSNGVTNPYLFCSISGRIYTALLEPPYTVTDLSTAFGLVNPADQPQSFFVLAETFLVIQAGDGVTLPLFWDGSTMRRSVGIINFNVPVPAAPAAPTVYVLSTFPFTVPPVGSSTVLHLVSPSPYPGAVNDVGVLGAVGTYKVLNIDVPGNNITIETISSNYVGQNVRGTPSVNFTITNTPSPSGGPFNEIPAATCMDYYGGRLWYGQGRIVAAGDIVGGPSGTLAYNFTDSVLHVTENPLCIGGDGFSLPTDAGNIRAIKHSSNLNASLGQGQLYLFTRETVYMLAVPVTRTDWINANNSNQPQLTVVQLVNGAMGDRCVVAINGDLFYLAQDPSIRSLIAAMRQFSQWGNTPISQNEQRALQQSDRSLMHFSSGIEFDNRLLMLALPKLAADGVNVVHDAIVPLDFDIVSNLTEKQPPAWEGANDGLPFVQLFKGDFGGLPRAFSVVVSEVDGSLNVWELTTSSRTDNGDNRVVWSPEFPALTWFTHGWEYKLKQLNGGELWVDQVSGTVDVDVYYRVDADPCWRFWWHTSFCAARNCEETIPVKVCYPDVNFRAGYKFPVVFPEPPPVCDSMGVRPTTIGYQFQCKIVLKGYCRIRGLILYALPKDKPPFQGLDNDSAPVPQGMAKLPNPFAT